MGAQNRGCDMMPGMASKVLKEMEERDASPYGLTDEQVAEVERRRADPNRKFVTIAEVLERFDRRRA
jgi:hypothetical protein